MENENIKTFQKLIKINKKQSKNITYSSTASTKHKWWIMPTEAWQMDIHLFMLKYKLKHYCKAIK